MIAMLSKSLKITADRIIGGTQSVIAIKEHVDAWNRQFNPALFIDEPQLTGIAHIDVWLAAAAEYEAAAVDYPAPEWVNTPARFLKEPWVFGGKNMRILALSETPFAFSRRLLFSGLTTISATRPSPPANSSS
ncbi:MAG: hypothetical protein ABL915_03610 [Gallionella sp.]